MNAPVENTPPLAAEEPAWLVSSSPHAHSGDSVRKIMLAVIIALMPALAAAIGLFGWDTLRLTGICVVSCVAAEFTTRKLMRRNKGIDDLSAVVTGLLLAFNLPPALPGWMAIVGSVVAIVIAKQFYGGLGYNPFNPALIGRVFLLISFPVAMTTWSPWHIISPAAGVDAITTATPLGLVKTMLGTGQPLPFAFDGATILQFFMGNKNGCIGEVSGLALLVGGMYLLWRRCISWQVPVFYIGTVAVFAAILWLVDSAHNYNPLFHILTGGLILGAFFMATDMVTTPVTKAGLAFFGIGCGILTMVIRKWGGYPEGVSFAILIMNAFTPLLNRMTRPRVFGHGKAKKTQ
ncbi:MAG: RnfABCDGE type electron transport complex subunit D [Verrucomicrobiota bacterium]